MLSRDGRPTPLGDAIAHCGRIAKTLHILRLADEPGYRRQIKVQADLQEDRHALARKIFHGRAGQLHQRYQDGMEDQIGALGLVLNALVLFNTRYMDAAVTQLPSDGHDVRDEDVVRLSRSSGTTSTCSAGTPSSSQTCPAACGPCGTNNRRRRVGRAAVGPRYSWESHLHPGIPPEDLTLKGLKVSGRFRQDADRWQGKAPWVSTYWGQV